MEWAKEAFARSRKPAGNDAGASMDEHLALARRIARERGWADEELPPEPDPPPEGMEYLWEWFVDLAAGRPGGGFGPSPIGWQDIAAWSALTDRQPTPWEVSVLRKLDSVYLEVTVSASTTNRRSGSDRSSNIRLRR